MISRSNANAFVALLKTFAGAVQANDGDGLAMLFTPDGVYEDGFFGPHRGRASIAGMLQHGSRLPECDG